ncbi:MAG: glycoside hydrolase family 125 protein [Acidobacteriaceae bacterium]
MSLTTRRSVLRGFMATATAAAATPLPFAAFADAFPQGRPALADRRFTSPAIEAVLSTVKRRIADPRLAAMFERCLPNTLDTTVYPGTLQGKPDTFVVTGDIDAMWLRDSSAQVLPYLRFTPQDPHLSALIEGLVRRQTRMVLIDPYANAFTHNLSDPPLTWAAHDKTTMLPGVAERKWEVDSLCYVIRLAHGYWRSTGNPAPFDLEWKAAAWKIVATFRQQQRLHGPGLYSFGRLSMTSSENPPLDGYGNPARPVGMIFSMFRPSDDACIYPFLIPANLFAVQALTQIQQIATHVLADSKLAAECADLSATVRQALARYGICRHPVFGSIWAYEADGYGNVLMMDDANAPSLLSLPYLGICSPDDAVYQRTRQFVLSNANPYFFTGKAAQGVGSPHTGLGQIWPLAIILRALTSSDDREIVACLRELRDTTAGTGFIHESFDDNDPRKFTRPWFAWANTLFGELILQLAETRPALLQQTF